MTLLDVVVAIYRFIVALWNACTVFLQVMRSVIQEAEQEAGELMAVLDPGAPTMDTITATSLLQEVDGAVNQWQMLIIARASSFVLLFRLSKRRVLQLEVDERFIVARLEVIRTELVLNIQHVPRLMPIGMHDTRLVRYVPMKLPYVWKEEQAEAEVVRNSVVPVSAGSRRKKCVQLLTESAVRRRLHMDRVRTDVGPRAKHQGGQRKALANATNEERKTATPKQVRMERRLQAALSENLSMPNMAQVSMRRRQYKLTGEFSLVPKMSQ